LKIHGDEKMSAQGNIHFFVNWAKERLDEMDATLTSLEGKVGGVQADARDKANKILADLRKKRDDFRDTVKKQSEVRRRNWSLSGAPSRPRSRNISRISASKSSNSRRLSSFKPPPN
jgi:uncharacterized protein YoxC